MNTLHEGAYDEHTAPNRSNLNAGQESSLDPRALHDRGDVPVYPKAPVSSRDHQAGAIPTRDDRDGRAAATC